MSYNLKDIRDLRVEWGSEYTGSTAAAIHFETGDRRFHIWLRVSAMVPVENMDEVTFSLDTTLHSNAALGQRRDHRALDLNANAHRALLFLISQRIAATFGTLDAAVREAARRFIEHKAQRDAQFRIDLATAVRDALKAKQDEFPRMLFDMLVAQDDDRLIAMRNAFGSTKTPEHRGYDGRGTLSLDPPAEAA